MPTYDYECLACKSDFVAFRRMADRLEAPCPRCGSTGRQLPPQGRGPAAVLFKPGLYHNIDYNPIHCETAQDLRNACDKHNVYSHYLEDSTFKTSPGPDPTPESAPECFGGSRGDSEAANL